MANVLRWQKNLIGDLAVDIWNTLGNGNQVDAFANMELKLGYRNRGDKEEDWKEYASTFQSRQMVCGADREHLNNVHNCSMIPIFDLGALHHDYYLLNIRIPSLYLSTKNVTGKVKKNLGPNLDIWLLCNNQNGGFTMMYLSFKTIFFFVTFIQMIWFFRSLLKIGRKPQILEVMLLTVASFLTILNLPVEYLTLAYNLSWIQLFEKSR